MSALRNLVDKIKPTFTKGGKLGFLESTFDAFETFLFVPDTTTSKGAHIRDCNDMKRTMIMVVVALMPALLFGFYNTGYLHFLSQGVQPEFWASLWFGFLKVLPIIVVSYVVGLGIEFAFAQARGHEVNEGFLVTGLLIPMIMPVDIPLWMVALATAFSVIFGKEVFGGYGSYPFNPAAVGYAVAAVSWPEQVVRYPQPYTPLPLWNASAVPVSSTIEDTLRSGGILNLNSLAIALGEAIDRALGSKAGIARYGFALPMDDCRALTLLDFGGRIDFEWDASFRRERVGDVPTEMFRHFFHSFACAARCNLQISARGDNDHHKAEAVFKAFARALRMAVAHIPFDYTVPSSKGVL